MWAFVSSAPDRPSHFFRSGGIIPRLLHTGLLPIGDITQPVRERGRRGLIQLQVTREQLCNHRRVQCLRAREFGMENESAGGRGGKKEGI